MLALQAWAAAAAHWLGNGALDGTLFALVAWVASITLLRRSSGRVMSLLWLLALLKFVIAWPLPVHPLSLTLSAASSHPVTTWLSRSFGALAILYASTVALLLVRLFVRQARLRRNIATLPAADSQILERVRSVAEQLRFAGAPDTRVTEAAVAPFVVGPAAPTLVLPRWLCVPGPRLDAVLLHELAHLERWDHWVMWCERIIATVFFFWPPVHFVARKLDEARELACDERAIQRGAFSPMDYGRHLVDVVAMARGPRALHSALAIGRSAWRLERRIDHLLDETRARRASWRHAAILVLLGTCACFELRFAPTREQAAAPAPVEAEGGYCDGSGTSHEP